MRVFVAGGSGLIGRRLVERLVARGDQPVVLSRNATRARAQLATSKADIVEGDPLQPASWMERVAGCQGVVNLVGESLFARRWNDAFKQVLRDSRVQSTKNIVDAITKARDRDRPYVLVNASAIGYYGFTGDQYLTEDSPAGSGDFLSELCKEWEAAARQVEAKGVRLVLLRSGMVLDKTGGALKSMLLPFKLFAGGPVAGGRQWVSWIHHADEVGLILLALDRRDAKGPLNAVAPVPVTNAQLAKALGKVLWRPSFMPTPAFMLKALLGGVADVVAKGQRVMPKKAQELDYHFEFSDIHSALKDIVAKPAAAAAS